MEKNVKKLQSVHLQQSSPLQVSIWRIRRTLRDLFGKDILENLDKSKPGRHRLRQTYLKVDRLMLKLKPGLARDTPRDVALKRIRDTLQHELGYRFFEVDEQRPWGGFFRIVDEQTDKFLADFFPGLSQEDARLGMENIELSPKIMVWLPGTRISWQYHHRRAERWHFLTSGKYYRSEGNTLPGPVYVKAGAVVQFASGERHRGGASKDGYTLVAEIWQHTNPRKPSDESDIVRLADDFNRAGKR